MKVKQRLDEVNVRFCKDGRGSGFWNEVTVSVKRKIDSVTKFKRPENISDLKFLMRSKDQFLHFVQNFATKIDKFQNLRNKHSRFQWGLSHEAAFVKIKEISSYFVENHHFDVMKQTRLQGGASKQCLGAELDQLHFDAWKTFIYAFWILNDTELKRSCTIKLNTIK